MGKLPTLVWVLCSVLFIVALIMQWTLTLSGAGLKDLALALIYSVLTPAAITYSWRRLRAHRWWA